MKKFIALALVLASASVFAYPIAESMPVKFGSTTVQLHNTCLNADGDLQTPFTVKKYEYIGPRDMLVLVSEDFLTTPVTYTQTVCNEYSHGGVCVEQAIIVNTYPVNGVIKFYDYKKINKEQEIKTLVGTKEFTVPACK